MSHTSGIGKVSALARQGAFLERTGGWSGRWNTFLRRYGGVAFTDTLFLLMLASKPLWDALYFVWIAKYGYMLLLTFSALLAFAGRRIGPATLGMRSTERRSPDHSAYLVVGLVTLYLIFIVTGYYVFDEPKGGLEQIFKMFSPFILYWMVRQNLVEAFRVAVAVSCVLVIFGNALTLPFEFGWTEWGEVHTFKGFYYFKTDLAFYIVMSLLALVVLERGKLTAILGISFLVGGVQVLLSNARMNYLLFALLALYLFKKSGTSAKQMAIWVGALTCLAAFAVFLYDPSKMLNFDPSDLGRFTQGRNKTWEINLQEGVLKASVAELAFGRGLRFDEDLAAQFAVASERHDAHNEPIHLILTQGIVGIALYAAIWAALAYHALKSSPDRRARGPVLLAMLILGLQSMTAVVSTYSSKTWPVIIILLLVQTNPVMGRPGRSRQGYVQT